MDKSPIATTILASFFQFYVSIVDPSILAQPLGPSGAPGPVPASADSSGQPSAAAATMAQPAAQPSAGTSGAMDSVLPQSGGQAGSALH
jgi:hypothetical protein